MRRAALRVAPQPRERTSAIFPTAKKKTNARAPMGAFIGREEVLARIERAIDDGARLVTVLGPPGMGKTRLAERLLELRGERYEREGGAWFCDLSDVTDAPALVHAVASLWPNLHEVREGDDVDARLGEKIAAAGPMLLVLDNFEQLTFAGESVRRWCQAAPELRVVVTSRERLAVEGETVFELDPLDCPREEDADDDVLACEAVRLLTTRAAAIGGELGTDPKVLGALVRQLDGIPLAIELAAARTRLLPPKELADRLKQRFEVLSRRGDGRHARLASAIEWSWNLLMPQEQRTFAECSVFAGSFSVEAAEAIIGGGPDAVDRISALRDKSLLHSGPDGRLALYLSIRDYAAQKLEEIGAGDVRARHANHYAAVAKAFNEARTFQSTEPDSELRIRLVRDRTNLLAALAQIRSLPADRVDGAVLAELALGITLLEGAPSEFCLEAVDAALDAVDPSDRMLRARLLLSHQSLANALGRANQSEEDLRILVAMEDLPPGMRALALTMQGVRLRHRGSSREAWESHEKAVRHLEAGGPMRLRALNTACMGRLHHDFGDFDRSREVNEQARALAITMGDRWLEGLPLANVALIEQELGNFPAAAQLLDQALVRFREGCEPHYAAIYSMAYGDLFFEWDRHDDARRWYATSFDFFRHWLAHKQMTFLHGAWAALEAQSGKAEDAETHLALARQSVERGGSPLVRFCFETFEAHVQLRRAKDTGDASVLARETAKWRARIEPLRAVAEELASFEARFALRMLTRALDVAPGIVVAKNGEWFAVAHGARASVARRASLKRILLALVDHHRARPGIPLGRDALLAHGWPDERLHPEAASKRLRVAIATLRSLGLRDVLLTRDDGYLVDSATTVTIQ